MKHFIVARNSKLTEKKKSCPTANIKKTFTPVFFLHAQFYRIVPRFTTPETILVCFCCPERGLRQFIILTSVHCDMKQDSRHFRSELVLVFVSTKWKCILETFTFSFTDRTLCKAHIQEKGGLQNITSFASDFYFNYRCAIISAMIYSIYNLRLARK